MRATRAHARIRHSVLFFFNIMAKIDNDTIQRVLDRADIVEVISDFVTLKKKGARYIGLCPFHDDKHATNFSVYPAKQCYTCFACEAKGDVVKFLMEHEHITFPDAIRWLGKKYGIIVDDVPLNYTPSPSRPKPEPLPMMELPMSMVTTKEQLDDDLLVRWIKTGIRWDGVQRRRIEQVMKDYHVGHSKQGMTMWWQIDDQAIVRTGKMMRYRADGHRDKSNGYNFDWVHSALYRSHKYDETKVEAHPTLFGLHLLNRYSTATVCIVESEKTALLMAIAYGNHAAQVWMACGGLNMLNRERLAPIIKQHRNIILFPDRDGISKWRLKAEQLRYDRIMVDAEPVTKWWLPEDGEKADIADVVVRSLNGRNNLKIQ